MRRSLSITGPHRVNGCAEQLLLRNQLDSEVAAVPPAVGDGIPLPVGDLTQERCPSVHPTQQP